ncbi:MAG: PDC sensor domain-containing protein, partial [Prevotella sp.]|nr:PDC sensor domain-containing protein [Prevotella sp.]
MNLKEKFNKHSLRSHAGLWLMLVAILAMESIACVQYFYTRATIKADAVYRAQSELRSAEQEINRAAVELEAAAKMLAKMAEFCLNTPDAMPGCVNTLFETLENVEGAGIAFVPDYYPQKGHWYEVYATRNERTEKGFAIRQIGGADHDYTRSEWFNNGLTKDHAYWSNPYADNEGAHAVVVTCSYPVRDADNRVVGVVCIDISLSKLKFIFDY